jgi:hypothetical protein
MLSILQTVQVTLTEIQELRDVWILIQLSYRRERA